MAISFRPLTVLNIIDETPDAYTLVFPKPKDPQFSNFKPGQYLTLKVNVNGEDLRRAFSLSSSPLTDEHLSVTIKRVEDGRASNWLRDNLQVGDVLEVLPPLGNFFAELDPNHAKNYILIGAGSGITPLMSITKTVLELEPNSVVTLWYGNRNEEGIIFRKQFEALQEQYGERLTVRHVLSKPSENWKGATGRLDKDKIYDYLSKVFMEDEHQKVYYLCGPNGLMDAAEAALERHAVNFFDVHREYYSAPVPTEDEANAALSEEEDDGTIEGYELKSQKVTVRLNGDEHELTVSSDKYILDAAIAAQLDPPFACQSGICTTCRAYLHKGVVAMDESEGLSEEELREGFVLTCQSHPLTEGVVVDFG
ncbi:MAG: 2Fe-2S iron-sulfur cluster-binding protein [Bacteroidia bacterium]